MRIPLPKLMRHWREREFERHLTPATIRTGMGVWGFFARRPRLYGMVTRGRCMVALGLRGRAEGAFRLAAARRLMDAGARRPGPEGQTFQAQWKRRVKTQ